MVLKFSIFCSHTGYRHFVVGMAYTGAICTEMAASVITVSIRNYGVRYKFMNRSNDWLCL